MAVLFERDRPQASDVGFKVQRGDSQRAETNRSASTRPASQTRCRSDRGGVRHVERTARRPPRWPAVTNCRDRLTLLVRFAAIFLEPLRADRAEIVFTKRA